MIVLSMLLVIVGAIALVIGVFFSGDNNLMPVYLSIGACVLAALFLVAGIVRNRPSRKPVLSSGGEGTDATWSGATAWPGATQERAAAPVLDRDAGAADERTNVEVVTTHEEVDAETVKASPWAPPAAGQDVEPQVAAAEEAGADDDEVVVVPKRSAAAAKKTVKKAPAKKTAAKKAPAKKTAAKKTSAKKTAKKAPAKKTAAKKAPAKKTAKKVTPKKTAAKKVTPKQATAKKTTRKKSS